ncbi:MAG: hypothetical protein ACYTGB_10960 [Planctomycetota bacterium]|jgi:hypothetical protein
MLQIGSTEYDDEWVHLEIMNRCVALGSTQQLGREEIGFRFLTHFTSVPERNLVLNWIGEMFVSGEITGAPADDWALLASRFSEKIRETGPANAPADCGAWITEQFKASLPGKRPFDLSLEELDEFIVDAARKAPSEPGAG